MNCGNDIVNDSASCMADHLLPQRKFGAQGNLSHDLAGAAVGG